MTAPNQGPCVCDVEEMLRLGGEIRPEGEIRVTKAHEHAEFEPYACADCDCEGFRPPGSHTEPAQNRAQINGDGQTPPPAGDRPHLTIPAVLDFSHERIETVTQWVDQTITGIRDSGTTNLSAANEPIAVCALADLLETNWPEDIDPYDAIALLMRRLATNRTPRQAAIEAIRRKVQR